MRASLRDNVYVKCFNTLQESSPLNWTNILIVSSDDNDSDMFTLQGRVQSHNFQDTYSKKWNQFCRNEEWAFRGQPELGQVFNSVAEAL